MHIAESLRGLDEEGMLLLSPLLLVVPILCV